MPSGESYINERLDHLGIVAAVCQEIGLGAWLDAQDPTNRQQVSVGTATVAMVLNGLGFSNRQLYLVPQFLTQNRDTCKNRTEGKRAGTGKAFLFVLFGVTTFLPGKSLFTGRYL